jgi:hypothetical protein
MLPNLWVRSEAAASVSLAAGDRRRHALLGNELEVEKVKLEMEKSLKLWHPHLSLASYCFGTAPADWQTSAKITNT